MRSRPILSDDGREDQHLYKIEHRRTELGPAEAERFLRGLPPHALGRARQGEGADDSRGMTVRTPYQVFKKGIRKPRSRKKSAGKEVKTAA
ncbi:MAG: hypothetical protein F4Y74_11840 [Gemmatimonadales bacterium]|nr:hypothetical protein [Gemmatimonadales bacterium]